MFSATLSLGERKANRSPARAHADSRDDPPTIFSRFHLD